jgi:OPA family glycerol-3-phosphate transporter-like MFS transporter
VPALALVVVWIAVFVVAKDTPGEAGHVDFDTADASSGEDGVRVPVREVFRRMLRNPVIRLIALIEFCSGFLRQAIMQWYRTFAKATGQTDNAIYENWGLLLCCAGILGGVFAGTISDHLFKSRRGPVAAVLYGLMLAGAFGLFLIVSRSWGPIGTAAFEGYAFAVGGLVVFMSMCIIGVHGMLSGTASMDFGGRNNVGVAVGIIDGFVYAGTAVMAVTYGSLLPDVEFQSASQCVVGSPTKVQIIAQPVTDWLAWPLLMIPVAALGLWLARKIWHATPQSQAKK